MRFSFAAAASALVAFSLSAIASAVSAQEDVKAQTSPIAASTGGPLSSPRVWLVDNKAGLVTVREKDGPYLFAQVITTPNLTVEATKTAAGVRAMTLKDATGKRLYAFTFPTIKQSVFDFYTEFYQNDKNEKMGGITFTMTPTKEADTAPSQDANLTFVLDKDDWPLHGDFVSGTNRTLYERKGLQLTATEFENGKQTEQHITVLDLDKKTVTGTTNGKEVGFVKFGGENEGLTGRDSKGEIKSRTVKRGDKYYTELTVGDRKILIEGGWWFHLDEGDLFVTQSEAFTSPGKPAENQPAAKP